MQLITSLSTILLALLTTQVIASPVPQGSPETGTTPPASPASALTGTVGEVIGAITGVLPSGVIPALPLPALSGTGL
ncbi:hypothetical protein CPC08DRAFT_707959 [Agrocybe pediades]|nr:hypothetical protein CPC08DRAFT_707959 [Agrocybe pediades]